MVGALLTLLAAARPTSAQEWLTRPPETLLPRDMDWHCSPVAAPNRATRVRVFGTPSGLTSDIVRQVDADNEASRDPTHRPDDEAVIDVSIAPDNPFFDFREPGDLGGLGYQRIYSEVPLFDMGGGGLTLNCHASTPSGSQANGVESGPTRLNPSLTWMQDLGEGAALQGFIGKTVRANARGLDSTQRNVQYGMVLQSPVPGLDPDLIAGHKIFLFVETLGRTRLDDTALSTTNAANAGLPPTRLDVLPGVHWQTGDNWWLSTGVKVPVGPARTDTGHFQVTCSWRF